MENIYTISMEHNNTGFVNSDKVFSTSELAYKYMIKISARIVRRLRNEKFNVKYIHKGKLDANNTSFCATILLGGLKTCNWERYDIRVVVIPLLNSESDFDKYPIQF